MLEGLDLVDWKSLQHAYGSAIDTPQYIRLLASADEGERKKAYDHLISAVNHQGSVYSVTPAVVPFLIELLNDQNTPERHNILRLLISFVESCNEHLYVIENALDPISIGIFQIQMQTYNHVASGLDVYIRLLTSEISPLRRNAAQLFKAFVDRTEQIRPALWAALQSETDAETLCIMLDSFATHLATTRSGALYSDYFTELCKTHSDKAVRLQAAMSLIISSPRDFVGVPNAVPDFVIDILIDALNFPTTYGLGLFSGEIDILKCFYTLGDKGMERALQSKAITTQPAHLIARLMLDRAFYGRGKPLRRDPIYDWEKYQVYGKVLGGFKGQYDFPREDRTYRPGTPLNPLQRQTLEQIIACEPFWKMKTNLFSFFFGLPDERNTLKQLLSK